MENRLLIYYSHPAYTYFTEIEDLDTEYLSQFQKNFPSARIIYPNQMNDIGMEAYLKAVNQSDIICYRGNTWGVVFEVLTAIALSKHVSNIEQRRYITKEETLEFVKLFKDNHYSKSDMDLFNLLFPDSYKSFVKLLGVRKNEN